MGNHSLDNGTLETVTLHIKAQIDHASVKQTEACGENQLVVNSMHVNYLHKSKTKPQKNLSSFIAEIIFVVLFSQFSQQVHLLIYLSEIF